MAEAEKHALEGLAARAEFIRDSAERRKMVAAAQDAEQAVEDWLDKPLTPLSTTPSTPR